MELVRYRSGGDWSALYVDGLLDTVGDHHLVDERIFDLAGVVCHNSNDFMQSGWHYDDVAKNLSEIEAYLSDEEPESTNHQDLSEPTKLAAAEARIRDLESQLNSK